MNVIKRLTLANVRQNKKRTVATILAIIMSAALICGTAGIAFSAIKSAENGAIAYTGDFHVTFERLPENELKYVTENDKVARYFFSKDLGYAELDGTADPDKPYLFIRALDDTALHGGFGIHLLAGRLPETETELLIPQHLITTGGIVLSVGDTVTFPVGRRVRDDGEILWQNTALWMHAEINDDGSYSYSDADEAHTESLQPERTQTYTVVGVMERPDSTVEGFVAPGFTAYTCLPEAERNGELNVSVTFRDARHYRDYMDTIFANLTEEPSVFRNWDLLEYQGALSSETRNFLTAVSVVVIAIIMVSSVFVIRNSFAISVAEKRRMYGILAGVGATPKQIRRSVLFEGFLYGVVGIPLGLLSGVGAIALLLKIVSLILGDMLGHFPLTYHLSVWVLVIGAVFSAVTIFFSALLPAVRAARIPPVEAIRNVQDVKTRRRELRVSPLTKKLFGIGGVIASKNLKRSRKKYRTTVVSLVVSISIFIALSAFVNMGKSSVRLVRTDRSYNVICFAPHKDRSVDGSSAEKLHRLAVAANADVWTTSRELTVMLPVSDFASEAKKRETAQELADYRQNPGDWGDVDESYFDTFFADVRILNDDYFKTYLEAIGDKTPSDQAVVVIDENGVLNVKKGDAVVGTECTTGTEQVLTLTPTVFTVTPPMGRLEGVHSDSPIFLVSEAYFSEDVLSALPAPRTVVMHVPDADAAEQKLSQLTNTDPELAGYAYTNIAYEADQERRVILVAEIFLYGFISVITLIGVTNIFNTVTTNMLLRSREFATLRSVGMTDREFRRMIRLESLLYGLKSLLIGVPLGVLGSLGFYRIFSDRFSDLPYVFPLMSILVSIVFVFLIVALTMRYSLAKINKQNIIETIRRENI